MIAPYAVPFPSLPPRDQMIVKALDALGLPASRAARGALAYAVLGLVPALLGLPALALLALGGALCVTRAGPPLLSLVLTGVRGLTRVERTLVRVLLGEDVPEPPAPRPLRAVYDGAMWRGAAFAVIGVPLGALLFVVQVAARLYALVVLSYPLWFRAVRQDGHQGLSLTGEIPLDTWPRALALALAGFVLLVAAGWTGRQLAALVRLLARTLLAPPPLADRVQDLEESRDLAVRDSAATLRRIERDLHDGAQARLIALAMSLTRARAVLGPEPARTDTAKARDLVDQSLGNARTALSELRDLVRGIHPPVLDSGLAPALASLSTDMESPDMSVYLYTTGLPAAPRPPEAVETIAYFCAAELLTNAARHAGASEVAVIAKVREGTLVLEVADNGRGGAAVGSADARSRRSGPSSSGLQGLSERVRTVDGTLTVDSPPGGPTRATVRLPLPPQEETKGRAVD